MKIHGEPFSLNYTICKNCAHLLSRVVMTTELEAYGIDEDLLREDLSVNDEEDINFAHYTCLIDQQTLEIAVIACNRFENKNNRNILKNPLI